MAPRRREGHDQQGGEVPDAARSAGELTLFSERARRLFATFWRALFLTLSRFASENFGFTKEVTIPGFAIDSPVLRGYTGEKMRHQLLRPIVALACMAAPLPFNAIAITYPLQPEEVQNAYAIGRKTDSQERTSLLKQYQRVLPYPPDKPFAHVSFVEFQTPYEQIVLKAQQTPGYTEFQAEDDYRANPGLIRIRVLASLQNTYGGPPPPEDRFHVTVSQSGHSIEPRDTTTSVRCNPLDPYFVQTTGNCQAYTREIDLSFDVAQFSAARLVRIKVELPQSHPQEITYDLGKLK
jgi:hypothetical protein